MAMEIVKYSADNEIGPGRLRMAEEKSFGPGGLRATPVVVKSKKTPKNQLP